MQVSGKTIVVTGGGNGIGRQLVLELLRCGARVAAIDIRQESLDETAALTDAGEALASFVVDITDKQAVAGLPDRVSAGLGDPDGLINNAGIIQPFVRFNDLDYDAINRVLGVNLYGTIHMLKAFLPGLLKRPVAHIVNLSSMGGFLPVPGQTIYGAAKAGVKLLSEGLYAELLETNVGVSVVMPGAVSTEITSNSGVDVPLDADAEDAPDFPSVSPEDAASIIVDGIEKDRLHVYVGRDSKTMAAMTRAAPKRATHLIYKQMKDLLG